jgi:hypothetical protein
MRFRRFGISKGEVQYIHDRGALATLPGGWPGVGVGRGDAMARCWLLQNSIADCRMTEKTKASKPFNDVE